MAGAGSAAGRVSGRSHSPGCVGAAMAAGLVAVPAAGAPRSRRAGRGPELGGARRSAVPGPGQRGRVGRDRPPAGWKRPRSSAGPC